MEQKDGLLIVHAADNFLLRHYEAQSYNIKYAIRSRIMSYIRSGKKVMYTPFECTDGGIPSYFPEHENITNVNGYMDKIVNSDIFLRFQACKIKEFMIRNGLENIEIGGVMFNSCVYGTREALMNMEGRYVLELYKLGLLKADLMVEIITRKVDAIINPQITDKQIRTRPILSS